MAIIDINRQTPAILINDLWEQFNEAINEELLNLFVAFSEDSKFFDVENSSSEENLNAIATLFGYSPTRELDESIEYLRKEIMLIYFNLYRKSSLKAYKNLFYIINKVGKIYNLLWTGNKLVRIIDFEKTNEFLDGYDFSYHFKNVEPLYYFDESFFSDLTLDAGYFLDDNYNPAILDIDTEKVISKHFEINYIADKIILKYSEKYLITSDYISYLSYKVLYHRKAIEVPHVGLQLNFMADSSSAFNNLGGDSFFTYPEIETSCSVTPAFNRANIQEDVILDGGDTLDDFPELFLDNGSIQDKDLSIYTSFYKLVAGIGKRNLVNEENINIQKDILGYWTFDDITLGSSTFKDYSGNNFEGLIFGDYVIDRGIFSKGAYFSGNSGCYSYIPGISFSNDDIFLQFWLRKTLNNNSITIFSLESGSFTIKVSYNESTNEITLVPFDAGLTDIFNYTLIDNEDYFFTVQVNRGANEFFLKINNSLVSTIDISIIGNYGSNFDLYLCSNNTGLTENVKGFIDEIKVYNKYISDSELDYIYTNKISNNNELDYLIYEDFLDVNEVKEFDDKIFIQSYIKGQTIKDENIYISDGVTDNISGTLNFDNINPNTVKFYFENNFIYDNGFGLFNDDKFTGSIDYATGDFTFNFFKITNVENLTVFEGSTSSLAVVIPPKVLENTLEITYTFSSTTYTANDDGLGNITGVNIISGSIDYITGIVNIAFSTTTDVGTNIYASYTKRVNTIPLEDTIVLAEYSLVEDIPITEVGIKNIDNELMFISSFPKCSFTDNKNHLAFTISIMK